MLSELGAETTGWHTGYAVLDPPARRHRRGYQVTKVWLRRLTQRRGRLSGHWHRR